tara:strand:+ start:428 stop:640 length:213 start_codon:yes stop_codon:yes gene_type:complete
MPAHLLPAHERRSEIVKFRLTAAELKELQEAAKSQTYVNEDGETKRYTISDLIRHFVEEGLENFKRQGLV